MPENLYTPNSIRTVSGRYVNILELEPATIHIGDIAHSLSHTPRFGGHLPVFFSVAQHSIGVHNLVADQPREIQLQALLHDASEYLIGDMPSPIKKHLPDFQALEDRIMHVIAQKYGFQWPIHPAVKLADTVMLEQEWKGIMLGNWHPSKYQLSNEFINQRFLDLFHDLTN